MEIDINTIYSTSLKIFTIIKEEYNIFLTDEQKKKINNIDIFHFYKIINDKDIPPIYFLGDMYYLNSYYKMNYLDYLPFICLSYLCNNLNPLKIGLIELELKKLSDKYSLRYKNYHEKETEVADIVSKTILNNLPYNVIFLENDSDIISYLVEEKDSKVGLLYAKISKQMKEKKDNDYKDVIDNLYEYVSSKIR